MTLQDIAMRYEASFKKRFGSTLNTDQWSALNAITGCRSGQYGELQWRCSACFHDSEQPRSCGHRSCNRCQQQGTEHWLQRQLSKQLPVDYYMATFTLPAQLRQVARDNQKKVYHLMMQCASDTLKTFGLNEKGFESRLGQCAVLHTHSRRLDYHPHVHVVVPGGGVQAARKEWRTLPGKYLFNGRALASVYRAKLLNALSQAGIPMPQNVAEKWVVQCQRMGKGKEALRYLSRYLYRGVISNRNILEDDGESITFRYRESKSQKWLTRTVPGETFLFLILQHVLPKGFRRARDYGFLHGNARGLLEVIQRVLRVKKHSTHAILQRARHQKLCSRCKGRMHITGLRLKPRLNPG